MVTNEVYIPIRERGFHNTYFALQINSSFNENHPLVVIDQNGSVTHLSIKVNASIPPRVSPDGRWAIISSDAGTELYSENLQLIKSWDMNLSEIIWRPDSLGIFLSTNSELYYFSIPEGEPKLVNVCSLDLCLLQHVWLP